MKQNKDPDQIKKIESEFWGGISNFDSVPSSAGDLWIDKWDNYLFNESILNKNMEDKIIINIGGGNGREAEFLLNSGAKKVFLIDIAQVK